MIKLKIECNKQGNLNLKMSLKEELFKDNMIIKRVMLESKPIKGRYNYSIPMKFFIPMFNNLEKQYLKIDSKSIASFLEFSDEYDGQFYYSGEANAKYMKKWRELSCPDIYRVTIDVEAMTLNKELAFKKISSIMNG